MTDKLLCLLKETDTYISGEDIGRELGVSRTSVWKHIAKLKEAGYNIEAVTNKGYKLMESADLVNELEIKDGLNTFVMGQNIVYFEETGSTIDDIRKLAQDGAPEGTIAIAEIQNAGKGRRGKSWVSPKGTGIWMSILLRPDIEPTEASKLTLIAGLSVCRAIRNITGLNALIKWPNDILLNNKKVCGILTELSAEIEKINFVVVGVGINVNTVDFAPELVGIATSLKNESGNKFLRKSIIQGFLKEFENYYGKYVKNNDFNDFLYEYKSLCTTLGKDVDVISKNSFRGKAIDITNEGELIVRKDNGDEEVVFSGEVSIRAI